MHHLAELRQEMELVLKKHSAAISGYQHQSVFLINNYDHVVAVLAKTAKVRQLVMVSVSLRFSFCIRSID